MSTGTGTGGGDVQVLGDTALEYAIQDANGENVYSNQKAIAGYLEAKYNLLVSNAFTVAGKHYAKLAVNVESFGSIAGLDEYLGDNGADFRKLHPYLILKTKDPDVLKFHYAKNAALNYVQLRRAGMDDRNAYVAAGLRSRWMMLGAYNELVADPNTLHKEHAIVQVNDSDAMLGEIEAAKDIPGIIKAMKNFAGGFIAAHASDATGAKFVVSYADAFWTLSEHLFRTRGHHFKNSTSEVTSYENFVDRYMAAAYEGVFAWPAGIDMFHVFHTAIHPFKIRSLVTLTAKFAAHGTMANSSLIRLSGAPVGTAAITTANAALDTMRGEPWYDPFESLYFNQIQELNSFSLQISNNRYGYHQSARLYGVTPQKTFELSGFDEGILIEAAKSRVSSIAAAAQGMINSLSMAVDSKIIKGFALSNARALEKAASANPMLAIRVGNLVAKAIDQVSDADNLKEAISNALPTLTAPTSDED